MSSIFWRMLCPFNSLPPEEEKKLLLLKLKTSIGISGRSITSCKEWQRNFYKETSIGRSWPKAYYSLSHCTAMVSERLLMPPLQAATILCGERRKQEMSVWKLGITGIILQCAKFKENLIFRHLLRYVLRFRNHLFLESLILIYQHQI